MSATLRISSRPVLSHNAQVVRVDGELLVETPDFSYTFGGRSAELLSGVRERLDGSCRIGELASGLNVRADELCATLSALAEDGVVIDADAALEADTCERFFDVFTAECRFWRENIYHQPFFHLLLSGRASPGLVLGSGVEFYHYVDAANEHMAASVAHCRGNVPARYHLARHYVEEHAHGKIFLEGLASCGLDRERVKAAPPLASTRALINFLNELAASDTLAYAGAFGIMQATRAETTREGIGRFYDALIAHYPFAAGLYNAYRKHALMDVDLDHQELLLTRIYSRDEMVTAENSRRILAAARDTAEHFILFFEGILDYYGAPGRVVPRPALDIRTLL